MADGPFSYAHPNTATNTGKITDLLKIPALKKQMKPSLLSFLNVYVLFISTRRGDLPLQKSMLSMLPLKI